MKKTQRKVAKKVKPAERPKAQTNAELILATVKRIPRGRVSTYGAIAELAGLPRRARLVGTVLRQAPASRRIPWFRVINSSGQISFPVGSDAYSRQREQLEAEGIVFSGGRVLMSQYGWPSTVASLDEYLWKV
jgi:methylated-DNA-protein-cysteine methyltransferase related protein